MSLARLRSLESVELMSAAIEHLVKVSSKTNLGSTPPPSPPRLLRSIACCVCGHIDTEVMHASRGDDGAGVLNSCIEKRDLSHKVVIYLMVDEPNAWETPGKGCSVTRRNLNM